MDRKYHQTADSMQLAALRAKAEAHDRKREICTDGECCVVEEINLTDIDCDKAKAALYEMMGITVSE